VYLLQDEQINKIFDLISNLYLRVGQLDWIFIWLS